jgi:hypothetical protein
MGVRDTLPCMTTEEITQHLGKRVRLTSTRGAPFPRVTTGVLKRNAIDMMNHTVSIEGCDKHVLMEKIARIEVID